MLLNFLVSKRRPATAVLVVALLLGSAFLFSAQAAHDDGRFELDGNAMGSISPGEDWSDYYLGSADTADAFVFVAEPASNDTSYFAPHASDDTDFPNWEYDIDASAPDKNELTNVYALMYDATGNDSFFIAGADRFGTSGDSALGVWLTQDYVDVGPLVDPTDPNDDPTRGNFVGNHVVGDLFIVSHFVQGGSSAEIIIYRWVGSGGSDGSLDQIATLAECGVSGPGDAGCGRSNLGATPAPWPYTPKTGAPGMFPANAFTEFGLRLADFYPEGMPCFNSIIIESRTSQSVNSKLKDFAIEQFQTCDARISIDPQVADNVVGDPHTYTITVERGGLGAPWQPMSGVDVNASITAGPGDFVGPNTCTTGADGTCTVTIVSTTQGTTTVQAEANATVRTTGFKLVTDGEGENSGPATKNWIRAPSTTTTTPSNLTPVLGDSVWDSVAVTGDVAGAPPSGTVDFYVCNPAEVAANGGTCSANGTFISTETLNATGEAASQPVTPTSTGTWCFRGEYSGDQTYNASSDSSLGECFGVQKAPSSTVTLPTSTSIQLSESVSDTVVVTGNPAGGTPTGTVTFYVCDNVEVAANGGTCSSGGTFVSTETLNGTGQAVSASVTPASDVANKGTWCFRGEYSGDANYLPSSDFSVTECFTVRGPESSINKSVRVLPDGTYAETADADPGDDLQYQVVYRNSGDGDAHGVVVKDAVPERTTLDLTSLDPACEAEGPTPGSLITCDLGTVAAGASVTLTYVVALDAVFPNGSTKVPNTATADTDEEGPIDDSTDTNVDAAPKSAIAKSVRVLPDGEFAADLVGQEPGAVLEYQLTYTNDGNAPAANVTLVDAVVAHAVFRSCTDNCQEAQPGDGPGAPVVWELGTVQPGTTHVVSFQVTLDAVFPNGTTLIPNLARSTTDEEGTLLSNFANVSVVAQPVSNLVKAVKAMSGTFGVDDVGATDGLVSFRLNYTNSGNADATQVTLMDRVIDRASFVSCSHGCIATPGGGPGSTITWQLGTVEAGESREVTVTVKLDAIFPNGETILPNTAAASTAESEDDDVVSNTVQVRVYAGPNTEIVKRVSVRPDLTLRVNDSAEPSDIVVWTLQVSNTGNAHATNVVVSDVIGPSQTLLDCNGCTMSGGGRWGTTMTWNLGQLDALTGVATVNFTVRLDPVFPFGATNLTNTAAMTSTEEGEKTSNVAWVLVHAAPQSSLIKEVRVAQAEHNRLTLDKEANRATASPGDAIQYTLTLANTGTTGVEDVLLKDILPGEVALAGCTGGCVMAGNTATWTISSLAAGEAVVVTLDAFVVSHDSCQIRNQATATSANHHDGATIASPEVIVSIGPDASTAMIDGRATSLAVGAMRQGDASSSRTGPGSASDEDTAGPIGVPPADGRAATADAAIAFTAGTVDDDTYTSSQRSVAEVTGLNILDGFLTADKIRAVADARASGHHSAVSAVGSSFDGLLVDGVAFDKVAPNTRIDLPGDVFGEGSHIVLRATEASTPPVHSLTAGAFTADISVTMIRLVLADADPVSPGAQPLTIEVAKASAVASFAQTPRCNDVADQEVAGQASVASTSGDGPSTHAGRATMTSDGSEHRVDAGSYQQPPGTGRLQGQGGHARTVGALDPDFTLAISHAEAHGVCLLMSSDGCAVAAEAVSATAHAYAASTLSGSGSGSDVAGLTIFGVPVDTDVAPNTVVEVPGVGYLVLNQQLLAPDALTGTMAVEVRALELVVTVPDTVAGQALGATFTVAEAVAAAMYDPNPDTTPPPADPGDAGSGWEIIDDPSGWGTDLAATTGDVVEYRLTYRNDGNANATSVRVADSVVPHATLRTCPACDVAATPVWTHLLVAPGAEVTQTFAVKLDAVFPAGTTTIPNQGAANNAEGEDVMSNFANVTVNAAPSLTLAKSLDVAVASPGDVVTYTFTAANHGDAHATGAILQDAVPPGLAIDSASCNPTCTVDGQNITFDLGTLDAGAFGEDPVVIALFSATVSTHAVCELCNVANLTTDQTDTVSSQEVCLRIGPDTDTAVAAGHGLGFRVSVGTLVNEQGGYAASSQAGAGDDEAFAQFTETVDIPEGYGTVAHVGTAAGSSAQAIDDNGALSTSWAEASHVSLLDGLVQATSVRADASAFASGDDAWHASNGHFDGLTIDGVATTDVQPGTMIPLPQFGLGSHVTLYEREEQLDHAPSAVSGEYTASVRVTMIHVYLVDGDLAVPGDQPVEIRIGEVQASATFPQTPLCSKPAVGNVAGHGALVTGSFMEPIGVASVDGPEGDQSSDVGAYQDSAGRFALAGGSSRSTGMADDQDAWHTASARITSTCLLPGATECLISAAGVDVFAATAAGTSGLLRDGGAHFVDLEIAGVAMSHPVGVNETIDLPGLRVTLNQQEPGGSPGAPTMAVRALRVDWLDGPLAGESLIIGEAFSSSFAPA